MHKRLKFITHKDKEVLYIDANNATAQESFEMTVDIDKYLAEDESKAPFLLLADYTDAKYDQALIEKIRSSLKENQEKIHRFAAYGISGITKIFVNTLASNLSIDFKMFDTKEEALEWLVED